MKNIETFITEFNDNWLHGKLDELSDLLDHDVVFIAPDLTTEIKGREQCLQSFIDYLDTARTKKFQVRNKQINSWRDSASVLLEYYVEYELNETEYHELGKKIQDKFKEVIENPEIWDDM